MYIYKVVIILVNLVNLVSITYQDNLKTEIIFLLCFCIVCIYLYRGYIYILLWNSQLQKWLTNIDLVIHLYIPIVRIEMDHKSHVHYIFIFKYLITVWRMLLILLDPGLCVLSPHRSNIFFVFCFYLLCLKEVGV